MHKISHGRYIATLLHSCAALLNSERLPFPNLVKVYILFTGAQMRYLQKHACTAQMSYQPVQAILNLQLETITQKRTSFDCVSYSVC